MLKRLVISMASAAGLAAGAAAAQPAPLPGDPAGPASAAREVVEPWIAANVRADGWRRAGPNAVNEFLAPERFVKSPDGKVRTQIRLERFQPAALQGFTWRSAVQGVEFDCTAANVRFVYLAAFPGLNLQGNPRRFDIGNHEPTPSASVAGLARIHEMACATEARLWPAEPAPPAGTEALAMHGWLAANVDQGVWRLGYLVPAVAAFVNPGVGSTPEGWREARIRSEFFRPQIGPQGVPRRSEVITLHVDCDTSRVRIVSITSHVQQNLLGAGQLVTGPPDWRSAPDNSPLGVASRAACAGIPPGASAAARTDPSTRPQPPGRPATLEEIRTLARGYGITALDAASVAAATAAGPALDAREAEDAKIVNAAVAAFDRDGYDALRPHLAAVQAVLDRAPARYPEVEVRADRVLLHGGPPGALVVFPPILKQLGEPDRMIAMAPNVYPTAAMILGAHAVHVKEPQRAIILLDRGLALQPDNVALVSEKVQALQLLKRPAEALAVAEARLASPRLLAPAERVILLRNKGVALIEVNRLDEAEQAFRESLTLEPGNALAANELRYIERLRAGGPTAPVGPGPKP